MKDLIDAAVQSAARNGVQAAVVLIGGGPQHEESVTVQTPAGVAAQQGAGAELQQQISALQEHLSQTAVQRDSALRQNEQLCQQFREAQARILQLEDSPAPPPPTQQQPTDIVDHESMGVDTLNLPEKVLGACAKHDVTTIGQLRAYFPKLGDDKVNQKDRILTAEALMGRISYGSAPAAAPAPAAVGSSAADIPAGHTDRSWKERLKVARFKETKAAQLADQLTAVVDGLRANVPAFPAEGEGEFWTKALAAIASAEGETRETAINHMAGFIGSKIVQEITSSQVAAMLYALGFDPKQSRYVDASLEAAGLVHLVESIPSVPA